MALHWVLRDQWGRQTCSSVLGDHDRLPEAPTWAWASRIAMNVLFWPPYSRGIISRGNGKSTIWPSSWVDSPPRGFPASRTVGKRGDVIGWSPGSYEPRTRRHCLFEQLALRGERPGRVVVAASPCVRIPPESGGQITAPAPCACPHGSRAVPSHTATLRGAPAQSSLLYLTVDLPGSSWTAPFCSPSDLTPFLSPLHPLAPSAHSTPHSLPPPNF